MLDLAGKILHFQTFGNRVTNAFAVVIAETRHFAYIKYLPQNYTYEDELKYHGTSVPDVSQVEDFRNLSNKELRRGKKYLKADGTLDYIASGDNAFKVWDGEPKGFDHLD